MREVLIGTALTLAILAGLGTLGYLDHQDDARHLRAERRLDSLQVQCTQADGVYAQLRGTDSFTCLHKVRP